LSTKIHAVVDALGNPTRFHLTGGQACDLDGADVLLPAIPADTIESGQRLRRGQASPGGVGGTRKNGSNSTPAESYRVPGV